jgi:hypothetical protein
MPKLTEAIEIKVTVETKIIPIDDAVKQPRGGDYRCPECGKPVIPFRKSSTGAAAHFEHHKGQSCR